MSSFVVSRALTPARAQTQRPPFYPRLHPHRVASYSSRNRADF